MSPEETYSEGFTNPPLTPPLTNEKSSDITDNKTTGLVSVIFEEIKRRQKGRPIFLEVLTTFTLDVEGYKELLNLIQSDESVWVFAQTKLREDYSSSAREFSLRMHTPIHEMVLHYVRKELELQLETVARGHGPSAEFARCIECWSSSTITFEESEYDKHDPDTQFGHSQAQYPGVIIEVSYSQKRKRLERLAEEYILGSNGDVRVVIGLDIEYRGSKKGTVSMWRPQIVRNDAGEQELVCVQTVTDQMFRDENGRPTSEAGLHLQLRDFADETLVDRYGPLCDQISIPAVTLCSYLNRGEERAAMIQRRRRSVQPTRPWVRKRARDPTPPEELEQQDEKRFRADEERAAEQALHDNSSYKASSASEAESG